MLFIVILLILAIGGRWACSTICPLGIIEELIFKIPFPKKWTKLPYEAYLRKIKYVVFFALLVLIPLVFLPNKESWSGASLLIKVFGFTTVFLLSLFIYRPFCKYLCPFGVFLGFFNRISPFRYRKEPSCNHCGLCKRKCKMGLDPDNLPEKILGNFYTCADDPEAPHFVRWSPINLPTPNFHCPEFFVVIYL